VGVPKVDLNDSPGSPLTAVLLHPHPDMGGNRFNHVIHALYEALPEGGFSAARFDFTSSDVGLAAHEAAAVVEQCSTTGAVVVVGYSFGAGVALHVTGPAVVGWVLVAPYLGGALGEAGADQRPKLVLVAERDQWSPPSRVQPIAAPWPNTTVTTIAGADHFLAGRTAPVVGAALEWLGTLSGRAT